MPAHEVSWSTFLREPSSVERWLRRGDVLLRRRDGEALRLSRESSDASEKAALVSAARLLGAGLARSGAAVTSEAVGIGLPWTRFLPEADRGAFAREFLETFEACADLGDFTALGRVLGDWKATAQLHAEGMAGRLTKPIAEAGPKVRRP